MPFVHLQVRSAYSLLNSSIKIEELVQRACELGFGAIALTDENIMYAMVPFYKLCKKNGIKPIIGLTVSVLNHDETRSFPFILLVKNNEGYQNLIKISSAIQTKGLKGIPKRWLAHYCNGLIAISPYMDGEIETFLQNEMENKAIETASYFKKVFGENFYLSIQNHYLENEIELNSKILNLANDLGVKMIATNHVHYLHKEDAFVHECLLALKDGVKLQDNGRKRLPNGEYYLKSEQEMMDMFQEFPDCLNNTHKIAMECHVEIELGQSILPKYPVPDQSGTFSYLKKLCEEGLTKRVENITKQYTTRLQFELSVIEKMNFSDYFLIVWDFMKYAHQNGIMTGPGRGSAAGSLVAFVLFITDIDPLAHDLLFERFLNPERVSMPDIDVDFPDIRRDEIIQYVKEKYGPLHVAQIITFGTFGAKSALRDAGRVMGAPLKELESLSKLIPNQIGMSLYEAYRQVHSFRDQVNSSELLKKVVETALKLEGLPRHTSTHAAGIIISEKPLVDVIPIQMGSNQIYLTQYPMNILEEIGLLKMDFLGLRNLTLIENITTMIRKGTGKKVNLLTIPLDDPKVFQLLSNGDTTGIFQLESEGMSSVLSRLRPTEFDDIVAVNALYRPGPMENIPLYIDRKASKQPIEYPHPDLEPILKSTYGVIIYQEQIIQIASEMANFSLGEADLLRRAVGKKKREILEKEREHFISRCIANGYLEHDATQIYDLIVRFANYGFNKSHAVAYSFIAYQLAYLKANYPTYFYAGLLSSVIGNDDKTALYLKEAKQIGIPILPPSINKSMYQYKVEKDGIRFSLAAIKQVGSTVLKEIFQCRKEKMVTDLFDFCIRTSTKIVNRRILESLIFSGAFDEFGINRASLLASLDIAIEHAELFAPNDSTQFDLLPNQEFTIMPKYVMVEPFNDDDTLKHEKEVLGFYLSSHPIAKYQKLFRKFHTTDIHNIDLSKMNEVRIGAYISSIKVIRTKKGELMAFLMLSDETGEIDAVAFPTIYTKDSSLLQKGAIIYIEGTIDKRNQNRRQIIIKKMHDINALQEMVQNSPKLFLKIEKDNIEYGNLLNVKNILKSFPGVCKVIIYYEHENRTIQLPDEFSINSSSGCVSQLKKILGEGNVVLK